MEEIPGARGGADVGTDVLDVHEVRDGDVCWLRLTGELTEAARRRRARTSGAGGGASGSAPWEWPAESCKWLDGTRSG